VWRCIVKYVIFHDYIYILYIKGFRIIFGLFFGSGFGCLLAFFPGTICLVFATVWN
jgi:hypothetical protein